LVGPSLQLAGAPQSPNRHRAEVVQQDGLADTAQAGEHHAPFGPTSGDTFKYHLELGNLAVTAGELGRALSGAGGVWISYRVHGIGLYDLI